ncbi:unnamed protein product [Boreogadus saida]
MRRQQRAGVRAAHGPSSSWAGIGRRVAHVEPASVVLPLRLLYITAVTSTVRSVQCLFKAVLPALTGVPEREIFPLVPPRLGDDTHIVVRLSADGEPDHLGLGGSTS